MYMCFLAQYINFGIPANVATFRFKEGPKIECECLQHNLKRQKVLQKLPMLKVLLLHGGTPNIICLKTYSFVSTISQFPWG